MCGTSALALQTTASIVLRRKRCCTPTVRARHREAHAELKGETDHYVSLLNLERSDEGRDVPWNGNTAQLCPRLSMGQDERLNTPA